MRRKKKCSACWGSIVVLLSRLSACSLSRLLNVDEDDIYDALDDLHAILDIPEDKTGLIRLHHPSFRDFLLDKERCADPDLLVYEKPDLWVDEKEANHRLADNCIRLMSASLHDDICAVGIPGTFVNEVERSQMERNICP
jgi:hypothetical protein